MKNRTLAYGATVLTTSGLLLAFAVMLVAAAELVNGALCCWQSECDE